MKINASLAVHFKKQLQLATNEAGHPDKAARLLCASGSPQKRVGGVCDIGGNSANRKPKASRWLLKNALLAVGAAVVTWMSAFMAASNWAFCELAIGPYGRLWSIWLWAFATFRLSPWLSF